MPAAPDMQRDRLRGLADIVAQAVALGHQAFLQQPVDDDRDRLRAQAGEARQFDLGKAAAEPDRPQDHPFVEFAQACLIRTEQARGQGLDDGRGGLGQRGQVSRACMALEGAMANAGQ